MADHTLPDQIRDEIRAAMETGERMIWFDRPRLDILMHRVNSYRTRGLLVGVLALTAMPAAAFFFFTKGGSAVAGVVCLFMMVVFTGLGYYALGAPRRLRESAHNRPSYALTDRRLLVHLGVGKQPLYGRSGASSIGGTAAMIGIGLGRLEGSIASIRGEKLTRIQRLELNGFPDAGELCFGRDIVDEPANGALFAVGDLRQVEKLVRGTLVDPYIEKVLRGAPASKEETDQPSSPSGDGQSVTPDANIRDFVAGRATPVDQDDPNIKDAPKGTPSRFGKVPVELKEVVEAELTAGEKVLWAARPERGPQGRGVLGALTSADVRKEPEYTLFAITNRRAILWADKGTRIGRSKGWGGERRGPLSYYPPGLSNAGLEADRRIPDGGNIVFKKVRVRLARKDRDGRLKYSYEMHSFGLMHVRDYQSVARLMYETLVEPCQAG